MNYNILIQNVKEGKAPIPTFKTTYLGGFAIGKGQRFEVRDFEIQGVKTVEDFVDLMEGESLDRQHGYYIQIPGTEPSKIVSAICFLTADEIQAINLLPPEDQTLLHENITELIEKNRAINTPPVTDDETETIPGDSEKRTGDEITSGVPELKALDEMTKDDFARELISMQVQFRLTASRMQLEEAFLGNLPMERLSVLATADGVKIKEGMSREDIVKACLKP